MISRGGGIVASDNFETLPPRLERRMVSVNVPGLSGQASELLFATLTPGQEASVHGLLRQLKSS